MAAIEIVGLAIISDTLAATFVLTRGSAAGSASTDNEPN